METQAILYSRIWECIRRMNLRVLFSEKTVITKIVNSKIVNICIEVTYPEEFGANFYWRHYLDFIG